MKSFYKALYQLYKHFLILCSAQGPLSLGGAAKWNSRQSKEEIA